ncbi:hypothetical protein [Methanolobus halotolerans]|uniref:DUF8180 domain-containing protein n=1 Tax=Methanolobus halotolerans TaxID=2052935 RepID=A0A4E0PSM8_9EURY|nr:hypothetical protein [Methanolobus halotolerans]TGC06660.1 hypothetical protein CUN85_12765 [Methanolobus halotolerans]
MTTDIDKEKLTHLLEHWIEHNQNHSKSFREWANRVTEAGHEELAEDIKAAEKKMDECSDVLKRARNKL